MKKNKYNYSKVSILLGLVLTAIVGCERSPSDDVAFATLPTSGEVFMDGFTSGLDYFPFEGSYFQAFTVDKETKQKGSASMRFDVPTVGDPLGGYAGAIFRTATARDLSGYDALTFWAKGTQTGIINEIGFGQDFGENKYLVTTDLQLTTNWRKYVIPIPDAEKLIAERGMFWYAEGAENGKGYSFWIDELKFEKLGNIAQPRPKIFNGENINLDTFTGVTVPITGLTQTFSLGSGLNQTVKAAAGYFQFKSSNPSVAKVSEQGVISIVSAGSAVITATLRNVAAAGSITVKASGSFQLAPIPTRVPSDVTSIYSDTYTNAPVDFFNGYWEPYQTTQSAEFVIAGNTMLNYTNFNFVGNQFANPTVDASQKSNLHINMYIPNSVPANMDFLITIVDFGADKAQGGGDDTREQIFFDKSKWVPNTWITLEFPITMANKNNIGQIIYENINFSSLKNFYLDNIYFYKN